MSLGNWDGLGPDAGTRGPDRDKGELAPDANFEDNPLGDEPAEKPDEQAGSFEQTTTD